MNEFHCSGWPNKMWKTGFAPTGQLIIVISVIVSVTSGKSGGGKGDLIPIPDHLKDQYNLKSHLVDQLESGELDYDEYVDLELDKHRGTAQYEVLYFSFQPALFEVIF